MDACRLESVCAGDAEHRGGRMKVDAEGAAAYPLEKVDQLEPESHPHDVAREGEGELALGVLRGDADEPLVVGVTADDLVRDDDIGGFDFVALAGEVENAPLRASANPASFASSAAYGSYAGEISALTARGRT